MTRVVDGLEGGETVADLGHMAPRLVGVVGDKDEDPRPAVFLGPGHGGVRSRSQVRGIGRDSAVVGKRGPLLPGPLGSEEPMCPHQAKHPVLSHRETVTVIPPQVGTNLAVSFTGERAVAVSDHGAGCARAGRRHRVRSSDRGDSRGRLHGTCGDRSSIKVRW